jgi:probable phosphoglycerate mutase
MRKIITIQHTQSEQHLNKMIGSLSDWNLTALGIDQANNIGKRLSSEINANEYVLYSSDLSRAKSTAEIVASYLGIIPVYVETLREFHLGEAIGHSKEWAKSNLRCSVYPETVDWSQNIDEMPFANSETKLDVWNRVSKFLDNILRSTNKNIIIVSHDGTLSILFAIWLGLDIKQLNRISFFGKTGGVSFLSEDDHGNRIIHRLNDMSYIQ